MATSGPVSWCWSLSPNQPEFGEISGGVSWCWPGFGPLSPAMAGRVCSQAGTGVGQTTLRWLLVWQCHLGVTRHDGWLSRQCVCPRVLLLEELRSPVTGMGICSEVTALGLKTWEWPRWEQGCVAGCALAGAGEVALLGRAADTHDGIARWHRGVGQLKAPWYA